MYRDESAATNAVAARCTASTCWVKPGCLCSLLGVSIGGWTAVNYAVRRPGRAASLTLLDAVMTFDRIPVKTLVASVGMYAPGVEAVRRRTELDLGGADVDELIPESADLGRANDYVLHLPPPKPIPTTSCASSTCRCWR